MTAKPTQTGTVLVVDHEASLRDLMIRWLRAAGHDVVEASNGEEALKVFDRSDVAVALIDMFLPGRDGLRIVEQLRQRSPDTALILATSVQDVRCTAAGLRLGVIDCLMKPFACERLLEAVRRGIEWHGSALAGRANQERIKADVERRRNQVAAALNALTIETPGMIEAVLRMFAGDDPSLLEHSRRVAVLARSIAGELYLPQPTADMLERAALVHDLPKLTFPESIFRYRSLLPVERDVIRVSPTFGHDLLVSISYLKDAAAVVHARYEWWDGSGYPRGLQRDAIPVESRILAVADTFDSLLQPRRYRAAMDEANAIDEILRCAGTQFDPTVVRAFHRARIREHLPVSAP